MRSTTVSTLIVSISTVLAVGHAGQAGTVTIEPIVRSFASSLDCDEVPDQPGFAFRPRGVLPPVINDAGFVAFAADSGSGCVAGGVLPPTGIYLYRPAAGAQAASLEVLADDTVASTVPGQAAGAQFARFDAPLLTDSGDVAFYATFTNPSGAGLFATRTDDDTVNAIVSTSTTVPGTSVTFDAFPALNASSERIFAVNNAGQVVFFATYDGGSKGLFASTVNGATPVPLAVGAGLSFRALALNEAGVVAYISGDAAHRTTVAGGMPVALTHPGVASSVDITAAGTVVVLAGNALYAIPDGGTAELIVDAGSNVPPNNIGDAFQTIFMSSVNDAGQLAFMAQITTPPNPPPPLPPTTGKKGIYLGDVDHGPIRLIYDNTQTVPGTDPPVTVVNLEYDPGMTTINSGGNVAFTGNDVRGIFFKDICTNDVTRIVDNTVAGDLLGNTFTSGATRSTWFQMYLGDETAAGRHRSLTRDNSVVFLSQFNNFDFGIYVAHVETSEESGPPEITCPPDRTLDCLADTSPSVQGFPTAIDACTGEALPLNWSASDATVEGCGGTVTITRAISTTIDGVNLTTCGQVLTLVDDTAPTITCPGDVIQSCEDPLPDPDTNLVVAADSCSELVVVTWVEDIDSNATCPTVVRRYYEAEDACGNASVCVQHFTVVDDDAPMLACSAGVAASGGPDGAVVYYEVSAADACDADPLVEVNPASGSLFARGVTPVSATGTDGCGNIASCAFDVLVSCFAVNEAKIGTKDQRCDGVTLLEVNSMIGTNAMVAVYMPEGNDEDLPNNVTVSDGANPPEEIHTSCSQPLNVGDVFGAYTVTDVIKRFDDSEDVKGEEIEFRGSFAAGTGIDLAVDDVVFTVADQSGHDFAFVIPAGSFEQDGNPDKQKFKFKSDSGAPIKIDIKLELGRCSFKFKAKDVFGTPDITGTEISFGVRIGANEGFETITMEDKNNHLKFKRDDKVECCPACKGIASMQVTSDQGVFTFDPDEGKDKLSSNTEVDDGVNGSVNIHTSCSQPVDVGDTFGAYTVSELVKVLDD